VWSGGTLQANSKCPPGHVRITSLHAGQKILSAVGHIHCKPESLHPPQRLATTSPSLFPLAINEKGCFEWYMCRSSKKLPGAFRSDFWTTLLIQASTIESTILHATLALSSAHKEEVQGLTSESEHEQTLFTVQQYSKAIGRLQSRLFDMRTTLIACALFMNMEFLRGHYTSGLMHLERGLRLLQTAQGMSTYVDGWIITIFTRMLLQAKLLGQLQDFHCAGLFECSPDRAICTFRSPHHARRSLEHIMLRIFDHSKAQDCATLLEIRDDLQMWLEVHQRTVQLKHHVLDSIAYHILHLYYRMAVIMANVLQDSSEMRFDHHQSGFLEIVLQSIETYKISHDPELPRHHDPEASSPNSILDIGWIVPLYFTAVKCRNHRIRHQAVRLLESAIHKEGIWNATLAVAVAREVIHIEEGDFYVGEPDNFDKGSVPWETDLATPLLPNEFRLSKVDIVLPDDRNGTLVLACHRQGWVIRKEYDVGSKQWSGARPQHEHPDMIAHSMRLEAGAMQLC